MVCVPGRSDAFFENHHQWRYLIGAAAWVAALLFIEAIDGRALAAHIIMALKKLDGGQIRPGSRR